MKINPSLAAAQPHALAPKTAVTPPAAAPVRAGNSAAAAASLHHPTAALDARDIDAARVAAIREDIRAGRYTMHPERIADGLLASVAELLHRQEQA